MRALIAIGAILLTAGVGTAAAQERLPRECRQEIRRLCGGGGREGLRDCLRSRAGELSGACRAGLLQRVQARGAGNRPSAAPAQPTQVIRYGTHERQAVDYFAAAGAQRPPLILFIHGGAWTMGDRARAVQNKPGWVTTNGYAFASAGYRVLPDAPVEEQARDVAAALRAMRAQAATLGFDPDRIVLMGHSAGAHLAALVATDPAYAGAEMSEIKGVILLDGAGYDVERNMAAAGPVERRLYQNAFGTEPERQRALSPVNHAAAPNAPNWLILHVADRPASTEQSRLLGQRLLNARAAVDVVGVANTDHGRLNRELGTAGDVATAEVARFLDALF